MGPLDKEMAGTSQLHLNSCEEHRALSRINNSWDTYKSGRSYTNQWLPASRELRSTTNKAKARDGQNKGSSHTWPSEQHGNRVLQGTKELAWPSFLETNTSEVSQVRVHGSQGKISTSWETNALPRAVKWSGCFVFLHIFPQQSSKHETWWDNWF